MTDILRFDGNDDGISLTGESDTLPKRYLGAMTIEQRRKRFDEARSTLGEANLKSQRDRDYYDGPEQLNSEVRETLKLRGQPAIYTNRIRPAVNGILGVLEQAKVDPRGYPRNPEDEEAADVSTKALRFIADQSRFSDIKQDVADNFLVEGTGACIIEMVDDNIVPTQIRFEEFYYDPYSRRADLADARYMGIAKWIDSAELTKRYPDRIGEIGDPMRPQDGGILGEMYEDRPVNMAWVDIKRRRVMLIEEYAIEEGEWKRIVYIAAGVLEFDTSPYVEFIGEGATRPICPIEAESCYVDKKNQRYGIVRDMVPIQDEVNASRSRSLHLMNSRQVQNVDPMAPPVDDATVRMEASKADGVIPAGWQTVTTAEMTQANLLRMQEAKGEIERMGPTPAIVGRGQADSSSGRSKQISQQAGLTELARPLGRLSAWELRVYRQMWNRARQFWTDPKWIRVTDNVRAPEFLQVNVPQMGMVPQPMMGPDGQPMIDPMTGQPAVQMVPGQVGVEKQLAQMDVDIIIDTVPDTATLQQEVWAELRELAASGVDIFSPQFELMIEMSPLSDKARIIERLKSFREEQMQGQAEQAAKVAAAEEEAREIAKAGAIADIENKQASTRKTNADAENKEVETMVEGAELLFGAQQEPQEMGM